MYFLTFSLLLFSAAFNASNTKRTPRVLQYNTRKVNRLPDDHRNCFCYPDGPLPTVKQQLDSQDKGLERVVIYLYKNVASSEIRMYTPNPDKQALIPDIPYEPGDRIITVTTEKITTLFNDNPYKIKVYNNHFEILQPTVTDALPIGLNVGAIEYVYPNDINNLTPNNKEYNGYEDKYIIDIINKEKERKEVYPNDINNLTPNNKGYNGYEDKYIIDIINKEKENIISVPNEDLIKNFPENELWNKWNLPEGEYSNNSPEIIEQQWSNKIKYPYIISQVNPDKHNPNINGLNENMYTFKITDGPYSTLSNSQSVGQALNNPLSKQYVTFNLWFNQQMKRFQNVHLPHDIKTIDKKLIRYLVQKTLSENNIYVSSDGMIRDSRGKVINASNLELRPMLIGEAVNQQILQNSLHEITLPKNLPYLEGILVTLLYPPHLLGIIPLGKTYLPETSYLGESMNNLASINGSQFYHNSFDSYKNPIVASYSSANTGPYSLYSNGNRELVSFYPYSGNNKEPVTSYLNSKYYREPLSTSYSYQTINQEPYSDASEVSYWSSKPYSITVEHVNSNLNPLSERRKLSDAKIKHHYEPPKSKTKKKGKELLSETNKQSNKTEVKMVASKEDTLTEPLLNINASESGRRFPLPSLKGVMKTLLYLLRDSATQKDIKPGSNSTAEVDIINESENVNDGERPDFRIIGGNAATGSGTPLSNKGRSGNNEYM